MASKENAAPVKADPVDAEPVKTEPVAVAAAPEKEAELSLDEFCIRLSTKDRRAELIGGFHYVETKKDRQKDTETAYRARFEAFVNEPA